MTLFNIDEQMEEGHCDQTGCFQSKTKDVCRNLYLKIIDRSFSEEKLFNSLVKKFTFS